MTYEEAYKKAKELAIKEVKTKSNGDYVYVVVNINERQFGIARNWIEFMYERMFGYRIVGKFNYQNQENCDKQKDDMNNDEQSNKS